MAPARKQKNTNANRANAVGGPSQAAAKARQRRSTTAESDEEEDTITTAAGATQRRQEGRSHSQQSQPSRVGGNLSGAAIASATTGGGAAAVLPLAPTTTTPSQQVACQPIIDEEAMIGETTEMLLEINNMTEREMGDAYRNVVVETQVQQFCKNTLFHKMKFIVNKEELSSLKKAHDIGNYVMKKLHVLDDKSKPRWWLLYQGVVKRSLDVQRSNCNMAVKAVMIGE
jgi:hypothetical protein